MNADRLHALVFQIRQELEGLRSPELLNLLIEELNNVVQRPQEAQPQQRLSQLRSELNEALASAPSNVLSPAWRQHLEELGIAHLLGGQLLDQIESVFRANEITPAAALDELRPLAQDVDHLRGAINHLTDGLSGLSVPRDDLDRDVFELGVLIPREQVDNELRALGHEFINLEKILLPFVELATGHRPSLEVRSIASSDFMAYVAAAPVAVACLAKAVEQVISIYKGILEVRALRSQLREREVPEEALGPLAAHVEGILDDRLDRLAAELRAEFGSEKDPGRRNELQIEIRLALNAIANRVDRGYNFEFRVPELPSEAGESDNDEGDESEHARFVRERLPGLQFMNLVGEPILALPEAEADADDAPEA